MGCPDPHLHLAPFCATRPTPNGTSRVTHRLRDATNLAGDFQAAAVAVGLPCACGRCPTEALPLQPFSDRLIGLSGEDETNAIRRRIIFHPCCRSFDELYGFGLSPRHLLYS